MKIQKKNLGGVGGGGRWEGGVGGKGGGRWEGGGSGEGSGWM